MGDFKNKVISYEPIIMPLHQVLWVLSSPVTMPLIELLSLCGCVNVITLSKLSALKSKTTDHLANPGMSDGEKSDQSFAENIKKKCREMELEVTVIFFFCDKWNDFNLMHTYTNLRGKIVIYANAFE